MQVTKECPASVTSDTVPTSSPKTKEQEYATEAPPTAPEMPTSTPPAQSDTLKNKHSGNTDDPQETVMDTTTGNRKRDEEEETNSIRELLLFIQTHSTGESRPLSRDHVNLVNREIRSKNLRMPETTSVSAPPRISRWAQPKTTKDNTRERTKITTRRRVSSSPVQKLSAAELSRISDDKGSTVYALYAVRSALLKHMSIQKALSGTVVSPFFDVIVIKAVSSKRPIRSIMVTGNKGGRLNTARTRQPSHRDNPVNCQGLPTLLVGKRQERKRSYFQYVTNDIPRYDTAPLARYGKMTGRPT